MGKLICTFSYFHIRHLERSLDEFSEMKVATIRPESVVFLDDKYNLSVSKLKSFLKHFDYVVFQVSINILKQIIENSDIKFTLLFPDEDDFKWLMHNDNNEYNKDTTTVYIDDSVYVYNSISNNPKYLQYDPIEYHAKICKFLDTLSDSDHKRIDMPFCSLFVESHINAMERKKFWKINKIELFKKEN